MQQCHYVAELCVKLLWQGMHMSFAAPSGKLLERCSLTYLVPNVACVVLNHRAHTKHMLMSLVSSETWPREALLDRIAVASLLCTALDMNCR
jgi:hypothetical protein